MNQNPEMHLHLWSIDALLVFIAFIWFLSFGHNGLTAPFSGDDLMNLHGYRSRSPVSLIVDNLRYWSTSYRPMGGLCYVALYSWFGFDPLPFRVACFGLLALNLGPATGPRQAGTRTRMPRTKRFTINLLIPLRRLTGTPKPRQAVSPDRNFHDAHRRPELRPQPTCRVRSQTKTRPRRHKPIQSH